MGGKNLNGEKHREIEARLHTYIYIHSRLCIHICMCICMLRVIFHIRQYIFYHVDTEKRIVNVHIALYLCQKKILKILINSTFNDIY